MTCQPYRAYFVSQIVVLVIVGGCGRGGQRVGGTAVKPSAPPATATQENRQATLETADLGPLELRFGDGTRKKLGDYLGKVVLLDFWATYCKPCVTKLPLLVALQRELGEQQLAVITITLDPDIATATNWAKANKMTLPIAEFTNNIKEAFFRGQETVAIPQARLLDRDGKLVKSWGPQDSFEKIAATVREMVRHGE